MPIYRFSDAEYAVIVDSLARTREDIRRQVDEEPIPEDREEAAGPTPNIDAALAKFHMWADPGGCEFIVVTGEDAALILGATEWSPAPPTPRRSRREGDV